MWEIFQWMDPMLGNSITWSGLSLALLLAPPSWSVISNGASEALMVCPFLVNFISCVIIIGCDETTDSLLPLIKSSLLPLRHGDSCDIFYKKNNITYHELRIRTCIINQLISKCTERFLAKNIMQWIVVSLYSRSALNKKAHYNERGNHDSQSCDSHKYP